MTPTPTEIDRFRDCHRLAGKILAEQMHKRWPTSAPPEAFAPYLETAKKSLDQFLAERNLIDAAERSLAMVIIETELRAHYGNLSTISLCEVIRRDFDERN